MIWLCSLSHIFRSQILLWVTFVCALLWYLLYHIKLPVWFDYAHCRISSDRRSYCESLLFVLCCDICYITLSFLFDLIMLTVAYLQIADLIVSHFCLCFCCDICYITLSFLFDLIMLTVTFLQITDLIVSHFCLCFVVIFVTASLSSTNFVRLSLPQSFFHAFYFSCSDSIMNHFLFSVDPSKKQTFLGFPFSWEAIDDFSLILIYSFFRGVPSLYSIETNFSTKVKNNIKS